MDPATVENIVNTLFPTHLVREDDDTTILEREISFFTAEELETAMKGLQIRRHQDQTES